MSTKNQSTKTAWQRARIAMRFVVFGIGGFWLLMMFSLEFIERVLAHNRNFANPFLSLPLVIAGAAMMLFGAGEWGRWAYLWVFLSTPLAISVFLLLPPFYWGGKEIGILVFALPLVVSYVIVRRYYRRRDAAKLRTIVTSATVNSRKLEAK
jgi:hypothetical protein